VPTTPLAVTVVAVTAVAVIVVGVVEPKVPFNAPVAGPVRPVVPSKIIDMPYPLLNYSSSNTIPVSAIIKLKYSYICIISILSYFCSGPFCCCT
jgi:hypothetical protein